MLNTLHNELLHCCLAYKPQRKIQTRHKMKNKNKTKKTNKKRDGRQKCALSTSQIELSRYLKTPIFKVLFIKQHPSKAIRKQQIVIFLGL